MSSLNSFPVLQIKNKKWCFIGSLGCLFLFTGCQGSLPLSPPRPLSPWLGRRLALHQILLISSQSRRYNDVAVKKMRCCWEIFLGVYDGTEEEITKRVYSVLYKED